MADFTIKSFDRLPSIQAVLSTAGQPINLTLAGAVRFIMRGASGGPIKVAAPAIIANPSEGVVRYDWATEDTDTPGKYQAEWEIEWADGKKQTVPTLTYHTVDVLADLDGA